MKAMISMSSRRNHTALLLWSLILLTFSVCVPVSFAGATPVNAEETLRLGERMYREGILPSGERMQAVVTGDHAIPGTTFTCESCHLRSGFGGYDENLLVPAITGPQLFKQLFPQVEKRAQRTVATPRPRPPYSDATLARAIREGTDATGRSLQAAMPRYPLNAGDMAIMTSYLKSLSSQFSPGASAAVLRFATVITDDVEERAKEDMLLPLLGFVDARNRQAALSNQVAKTGKGSFVLMRDDMMTSVAQPLSLSIWRLSGKPETWRTQLDEYYRNEPVFALVGGISASQWQPVHSFCEDNRIPCLIPNTDFPALSRKSWYTLYLSRGYYDEGEAAAEYLSRVVEDGEGKAVVEVVRDSPEGLALSRGFLERWRESGHKPPVTVMLKGGEDLDPGVIRQLLAKERPVAVLLWDGKRAATDLPALAAVPHPPAMVFVSSKYAADSLSSLDENLRKMTYLTYRKEVNQGQLLSQILTLALMDMKGNYYRDYLVDLLGMMGEVELRPHGRLTFGPTQRYLSRGGVARLPNGERAALVAETGGGN
jgi:hypothetical protein